jgi:hypothetical protein
MHVIGFVVWLQTSGYLSFVVFGNTGQPARWHHTLGRDTVCSLLDVGGTWAGAVQWVKTQKEEKKIKSDRQPDGSRRGQTPDNANYRRVPTSHARRAQRAGMQPLAYLHDG